MCQPAVLIVGLGERIADKSDLQIPPLLRHKKRLKNVTRITQHLNVYGSTVVPRKYDHPILDISVSGKIGVGVISRKHNFLENRPTLQTDLENMLVFCSKEK